MVPSSYSLFWYFLQVFEALLFRSLDHNNVRLKPLFYARKCIVCNTKQLAVDIYPGLLSVERQYVHFLN